MPNPIDENTLTADGTEQAVYAGVTNRVTQLVVNVDNMASGDTIVIEEKHKVLTGDSVALVKATTLTGADGGLPGSAVIFTTDPLSGPYGVTYTLQQTAGTNRDFKWRVDEL